MHDRAHGSLATIGIAVPLQGSRENSKNRLVEYLDNFGGSLEDSDTAPLDAVGYAAGRRKVRYA